MLCTRIVAIEHLRIFASYGAFACRGERLNEMRGGSNYREDHLQLARQMGARNPRSPRQECERYEKSLELGHKCRISQSARICKAFCVTMFDISGSDHFRHDARRRRQR